MNRDEQDAARRREGEAILERVRRESGGASGAGRLFERARRHFEAADADQNDRVEVTATRIGRLIGLIVFLGLAMMLAAQLLQS